MTGFAALQVKKFTLSDADFRSIRDMVYDHAGILLGDQKFDLVYSRLTKRLRELGLPDFRSYVELVNSPAGKNELEQMLNALTTNLTSFFRESHHFDHLKDVALRELTDPQKAGAHRLRLWSSACSTGEEPYSIAMTLLESGIDLNRIDARILATDLNTEVLEQASVGRYSGAVMSKCPGSCRQYFQPGPNGDGQAKASIRDLISFRQLNLLGTWPMKGPFDIVFCRNVLIYFDTETKNRLVDRFVNILKVGGWLYLGHSEAASGNHPKLELIGRTIYRKIS
ncbi:MAG: CheR family methyltransferase [Geminicoccaceae bacterium]